MCSATLYPYSLDYDLPPIPAAPLPPDSHPGPAPLLPEGHAHPLLAAEGAYPPTTLARAPGRALPQHLELGAALAGRRDAQANIVPAFRGGGSAAYFVFDDLKVSLGGQCVNKVGGDGC